MKQIQPEEEKLVGHEMRQREREREGIVKGIEKQGGPRKGRIRREAKRGEEPAGRAEGSKDISGFFRM